MKKLHDSFDDMIESLKRDIVKSSLINSEFISESKSIKADAQLISNSIINICDIANITAKEGYALYIEDPDTKILRNDKSYITEILSELVASNGSYSIKIDDIDVMSRKIISILKHRRSIRTLHELPSTYLVTNDNVVINLKTKEIENFDEIRQQYDILSKCNINIKDIKLYDKIVDSKRLINRQIISRVMSDWSNENKDVEKLLWQIIFSVLQNDNHKKFFILTGPGGNGKSTYMNLLALFAGKDQTQYANIHQFGDSNAINLIDMRTRVIIGDDAATNHKINDVALSNLKSIVTGDTISLPVKYGDNVYITSNALFIQGTNTDISFFENNTALKSRMIVINWTETDFRTKASSEETFKLDELIEDQLFIDVLAMMTFNKITYFDKFNIPEKVVNATDEMIESNDTMKQFLDDVYSTIDGFSTIPINALYVAFTKWSKEMNPSASVMKHVTFTKSLRRFETEYKFKLSDRANRRQFVKYKHTKSLLVSLDIDESLVNFKQRQLYISNQSYITDDELKNINIDEIVANNDISDRDLQKLLILAYDENQAHIISILSTLI